jgi:hypothetical protein
MGGHGIANLLADAGRVERALETIILASRQNFDHLHRNAVTVTEQCAARTRGIVTSGVERAAGRRGN